MIRISERGVKTLKRILEMSKPQTSLRILQAFAGLRFVDLFKPSKARKDRRGEVPRRPKRSEEVLKSPLGDLAKQLIEGGSAGVLAFFFCRSLGHPPLNLPGYPTKGIRFQGESPQRGLVQLLKKQKGVKVAVQFEFELQERKKQQRQFFYNRIQRQETNFVIVFLQRQLFPEGRLN
eukprot:TRINITY_DN1853_c0_g1_i2.p6 TRINITY_DN1853_c0_g1~~TRINITY_DN1853_c0_g1_i2.p6  ORF type:complete len:177 (-),score=17.37 TRINITY_DN1853_c0_g1_i2:4677-5207(-)